MFEGSILAYETSFLFVRIPASENNKRKQRTQKFLIVKGKAKVLEKVFTTLPPYRFVFAVFLILPNFRFYFSFKRMQQLSKIIKLIKLITKLMNDQFEFLNAFDQFSQMLSIWKKFESYF